MPSTLPWHYSSVGLMTVGTGVESSGEINVSEYQSWGRCVEYALSKGSGVVLLRGVHNALGDSFVNVVGEGKQIILAPGAEVRNCRTGAVGAFKLNSDSQRIIMDKGRIVADTWVNSQILISIVGNWCEVDGGKIIVSTADGNTSTPMEALVADTCIGPIFRNCTILPNKGVRGIRFASVDAGIVENVAVRNSGGEVLGSAPVVRSCYEVGRFSLCQHTRLIGTHVYGLGTLTEDELGAVWVWVGNGTGTNLIGNKIINNTVSDVASPTFLRFNGHIGADITEFFMGNSLGAISAAGEAGILFDSTDGSAQTPPDETKISGAVRMSGIHSEFTAGGDGNVIYFKNAKKVTAKDLHFHIPSNGPKNFIQIDIPTSRAIKLDDGTFDGTAGTTEYAVKFNGTPTFAPIGVDIGKNMMTTGCLFGVAPGSEPSAGFGAGYNYSDGTVGFISNLSLGGRQPILDTTAVALGGLVTTIPAITTASGVASGSASYATAILAQKINQFMNGLGRFQTNIVDNGGGSGANGTVDAVTDQTTFRNAIFEISTKLNEIIDAPKTAAGKNKLRKTMANGSASTSTQLAAATLTYSAGTISAANADNSINDSATSFPAFAAGDIIAITGFTGTVANNRVAVVVSRTTAKIVVANLNGSAAFVDDAAGETVTIRRLNPDPTSLLGTSVGALAKLIDNSGGAASVTGTLAATTTYNAAGDGANAIATLVQIVNVMIDNIELSTNYGLNTLQGT